MEPTPADDAFDDSDLFDDDFLDEDFASSADAEALGEDEDAELALQRMRAMRADLAQYDLEDDDLELLRQGDDWSQPEAENASRPVVAVIGRPNVGKSTLVNRVLGRREAVVQDTPGVTRDRVLYDAEWAGVDFVLVDTGGWEVDVKGLDRQIAEQAEVAIDLADVVIFVVDANVGATATDEQVVPLLRKSGKPVILAANKADSSTQESDVTALWSLGLGEPYAISALHGRGTGDMLDAVVRAMPEESAHPTKQRPSAIRRIALVGRPNVGKSSLLNALAGETRAVVHDLAGTTRDPIDEIVEIDGRQWEFIDTAGIKRRLHRTSGADYYASIRTQAALERSEVALVLVDASVPLTEQDVRVIQQAVDAGRGIVIVNNKWDLVDDEQRVALMKQEERELVQVDWAPRINLSAKTTWHVNRITRALDTALAAWETRVSTGRLNAFFGRLSAAHPHPLRGGKQPRILFGTQASTAPPRFVLFTTGFLDPAYRRFIQRRLREEFGFEGTPIQLSVRVRERRRR